MPEDKNKNKIQESVFKHIKKIQIQFIKNVEKYIFTFTPINGIELENS